jgi:hypothetical protein
MNKAMGDSLARCGSQTAVGHPRISTQPQSPPNRMSQGR